MEDLKEGKNNDLYEHHYIKVDPGQSSLRIDKYLVSKLPQISRNRIQNAAKASCIKVNDKAVKSNYKVRPGDEIKIVLPYPPVDYELVAENIPIQNIYEDEHLIVVEKPAGMVVHPAVGNPRGTLVNALLYHINRLAEGDDPVRPGLVHRIDKDTSGILVVAKSEYALTHLARQFAEHTIERKYLALVWGHPEPQVGTFQSYIGRHLSDRTKMHSFDEESKGKWAVTHYRVLRYYNYVSLVECTLETGRTHQIRVHFAVNGYPLFGDTTYGGDKVVYGPAFTKYKQFVSNCMKILPRQALHAAYLKFDHPVTGLPLEFESPLPDDMQKVIEKWEKYTLSSNV